jgi:gamma-glutamyltranspeptidase / glutathione hydrolase
MLQFDPLNHPYPSRRMSVYARNGMVCTSQPLAAQAGLAILRKGGNAIDAAIATAAALTVVEPTSNGIGGDNFALVWVQGKLYGLNSSGFAPKGISIEQLASDGVTEIPKFGWVPVTVPGTPAGWAALSERFGKLPLTEVLAPAIEYAEQGYALSPILGRNWQRGAANFKQALQGEQFKHWFDTFAPDGRAPGIGDVWRSEGHARTLQEIAETKAESFYRGNIAEQIGAFAKATGGYLRAEDLAAFKPEWVEPIGVNYRGYDVWEIPPNGHGIIALMALNILKGFDLTERDTVRTYHLAIEALKLAFADGKRYIADPRFMEVSSQDLLSEAYAAERRQLIGERALDPVPGEPPKGGTVYLCAADSEGNMISMIQSNYMGFGSGLVVPGTGIGLHNRGHNFTLSPNHSNALAPGKKPYHTIIPAFMTRSGKPVGPFGVMGGFMQPQGHMQVVMNAVDFALNPQAALDAPRWQWLEGKTVEIEHTTGEHIFDGLLRKGHNVKWAVGSGGFGRGEIIWRQENGVLVGATEPRTDGQVAAW